MKFCYKSKKIVPDGATVCPVHRVADCLKTYGAAPARCSNTVPHPGRPAPDDDQLRLELGGLERRLRRGRRRGLRLAVGTVAAVVAAATAWATAYAREVGEYAEVSELALARDPADPARVAVSYTTPGGGRVGIRRAADDRETELIDRAGGRGAHRIELRSATLREGEVIRVRSRAGWRFVTQELTVPTAPPAAPLGTARLVGRIIDATTGRPIPGATVQIAGTDLRATTSTSGEFLLTGAPDGPVGVKVAAPQFSAIESEKVLRPGAEERLDVALSPGLARGQLRVVLTWGDEPADLDAHLEGPLPGGKRFHHYYGDPGDLSSREFVKLDIDCQKGRGPETITVLGVLPGRYHYFVHDFTHNTNSASRALPRSGAKVEVYQGGQMLRRFTPKADATGNVWHVCDIDVDKDQTARVTGLDKYESKVMKSAVEQTALVVLDPTEPGRFETVKKAALSLLYPAGWKVGLAWDDRNPNRAVAPTTDRTAVRQAIEGAEDGPASLAQALEHARNTLADTPGARGIVIVTAGQAGDRDAVVKVCDKLKSTGVAVMVFTFGKADMAYLRSLASHADAVKVINVE